MVQAKQVVSIDDVLGSAKSDFHTADLELGTVNGELYGVPMIEDMQMLYYRKSMLSKAGIRRTRGRPWCTCTTRRSGRARTTATAAPAR